MHPSYKNCRTNFTCDDVIALIERKKNCYFEVTTLNSPMQHFKLGN